MKAWMIEKHFHEVSHAYYWTGNIWLLGFCNAAFSPIPDDGVKFISKEEAEKVIKGIMSESVAVIATEHIWLSDSTMPPPPQSADVETVREYRRLLVSALDALYEAIEIAPLDRIPRKAGGVIQDIQATIGDDVIALDRIAGKLSG